jgi:hypothetical protein
MEQGACFWFLETLLRVVMGTQMDLQATKDLLHWQCLSSRLSTLLRPSSRHAELAGRTTPSRGSRRDSKRGSAREDPQQEALLQFFNFTPRRVDDSP